MNKVELPPMHEMQRMDWLRSLKDGDWCFYEFHLAQVQSDVMTGVSDGSCWFGNGDRGYNAAFQPLDMRIKRISDVFAYAQNALHNLNCNNLNMPCLHRMLVHHWSLFCNGGLPREEVGSWCANVVKTVTEAAREVTRPQIHGVPIFQGSR